MKKLSSYLMAILIVATFMSCGQKGGSSDNAGTPKEKLDGKWKIVKAEGSMASLNEGTVYSFEENNKFTSKLGIIETKGDVTAKTDSSFSVRFEGMQNDFNYDYHFTGNTLVIELQNSGQIFTLEKQ